MILMPGQSLSHLLQTRSGHGCSVKWDLTHHQLGVITCSLRQKQLCSHMTSSIPPSLNNIGIVQPYLCRHGLQSTGNGIHVLHRQWVLPRQDDKMLYQDAIKYLSRIAEAHTSRS